MKKTGNWKKGIVVVIICSSFLVTNLVQAATLDSKGQATFFGNYEKEREQGYQDGQSIKQIKTLLVDVNQKNQRILPKMSQELEQTSSISEVGAGLCLFLALGMMTVSQKRKEGRQCTK